jgi:hypothetical protein
MNLVVDQPFEYAAQALNGSKDQLKVPSLLYASLADDRLVFAAHLLSPN